MFSLDGKKALVTGGSSGIGTAIAHQLSKAGATVVITGRREDALKGVCDDIGNNAQYIVSDLSNQEDVATLYEKAEGLLGQIDILVCNAGITSDNLAIRMKFEEWQNVINTNLTSAFILNKAALKAMMKLKWGRIINVTSIVGVTGNAGQVNYAASKAGMIGMTKSFAQEGATRGVTFNCVAPGFIKTPMTEVLNEKQTEAILQKIPQGSFGLPEDIASAVVYLASDEARYFTGQTLHVNGGMYMS